MPKSDLLTYIANRSSELFGTTPPLLSVFVRTAADGVGTGGSIGNTYMALATASGGTVERVTSSDYSGSMVKLSEIIHEKLQRSFQITDMQKHQQVHVVSLKNAQGKWEMLDATSWSAAGNTVTIEKSLTLSPDDQLKFEYY